jgi:hypothetical protein
MSGDAQAGEIGCVTASFKDRAITIQFFGV